MSRSKPKTKEHELFEQLHELVELGRDDAFAIKRLEREAEKLASVDVVASSILRSALSALQWDLEKTQYWVQNALNNSRVPAILLNGAISNSLLSQFDVVVELSREAISLLPKNSGYVTQAAEHLSNRGFFQEASMALESLDQKDQNSIDLQAKIDLIHHFMVESEVDGSRVIEEMRMAYAVAFSHKKRICGCIPSIDEDSCFVVNLVFVGNLDDEFALERSFAEFLAVDPAWNPLKLNVEFSYDSSHVLQAV